MKSSKFKITTPIENIFHNVYFKKEMEIKKWDKERIYLWRGIAQKCGGGSRLYNSKRLS